MHRPEARGRVDAPMTRVGDAFRSRRFQWSLALAMVLLIGLLDFRTEPEFSLLLFYFVPIFQATWFIGRAAGVAISCLSAAAWFLARYLAMAGGHPLTFYWNALTQLGIFIIVTYVISIQLALKRALGKEQELGRTDFLTGVMNRRAFSELLAAEVARCARYRHPISLAYVDLDNFKGVNDLHGHAAGDVVLQVVVETLRTGIRSTDTVARLGGDEFVVLFPETGGEAADRLVADVHARLDAAMREQGWPVTSSIGLVTCSPDAIPDADLVQEAERMMYAAKGAGKDRFRSAVLR